MLNYNNFTTVSKGTNNLINVIYLTLLIESHKQNI